MKGAEKKKNTVILEKIKTSIVRDNWRAKRFLQSSKGILHWR